MYKIILICAVLASIDALPRKRRQTMSQLRWRDCGRDPERPMHLEEFSISPMPIEIPGSIRITLKANTSRVIQNINTHVEIYRLGYLGFRFYIPCFGGMGSCVYNDTCSHLDTGVIESDPMGRQIKTMFESKGVQFSCPIQQTDIELDNYEIELPEIPSAALALAEGTYRMVHRFTETGTNKELGCFMSQVSVVKKEEPCVGEWWECLGKK